MKILLMSNEAHFHLNGTVNKKNLRYWAPEHPHLIYQHLPHSEKVTVWCALGSVGIIGPYFFQENWATVYSVRYISMLEIFLKPELRRRWSPLKRVFIR